MVTTSTGRLERRPRAQLAGRWLAALVVAGSLPTAGLAQVRLIEPEAPLERFPTGSFLTLNGAGCAVRFSSGALDRAHHLLRRLEVITHHLNRWGDVPVPTAVYVLERDEWRQAGLPGVYGVPIRAGPTTLVTAARGDADTVELWRELLGASTVPMVPGVPVRGTAQEAASMAIADVLLQVETARGFTQRARLLGAEAWIGELVSHSAALVIFLLHEQLRLPEISATFDRLLAQLGGEGAYAFESYRPALALGSPDEVRAWLWFQAKFHQGARIIVDENGKGSITKLQKLRRKGGGLLRREQLLERYPPLRQWLGGLPDVSR